MQNLYLAMTLLALLVTLALTLALWLRFRGRFDNKRLPLFLFSVAMTLWSVARYINALAAGPEVGFWTHKVGMLCAVAMTTLILVAVANMAGKRWFSSKVSLILLFGVPLILLAADTALGNSSQVGDISWWGYRPARSELYYLFTVWPSVTGFLAVTMATYQALDTKYRRVRRNFLAVALAAAIPYLSSLSTDVVLPALGFSFPPLSPLLLPLSAGAITYSLMCDDLLEQDSDRLAASAIMRAMQQPLFITDELGLVMYANPAGARLLPNIDNARITLQDSLRDVADTDSVLELSGKKVQFAGSDSGTVFTVRVVEMGQGLNEPGSRKIVLMRNTEYMDQMVEETERTRAKAEKRHQELRQMNRQLVQRELEMQKIKKQIEELEGDGGRAAGQSDLSGRNL
ncbi:histidine kinase N-terminal 7TM domain-containing protein [Patescibacteria group bacterium]